MTTSATMSVVPTTDYYSLPCFVSAKTVENHHTCKWSNYFPPTPMLVVVHTLWHGFFPSLLTILVAFPSHGKWPVHYGGQRENGKKMLEKEVENSLVLSQTPTKNRQ